MHKYIFALLISCSSDIAIITKQEKAADTAPPAVTDTNDSGPQTPDSSNPADEMTDLTIGFAELSLTQIACPACMGVSYEFDISATLKLHEPTSGGYTDELTPVGTCQTQQLGSYVSSTPLQISGTATFNSIQLYPAGQAECLLQICKNIRFLDASQ